MSTPRITPPVRLDVNTRRLVNKAIEDALLRFCEADFSYIGDRIQLRLDALRGSSTHWVHDLWLIAAAFHMMLVDHNEGTKELPLEVRRLVGIALHHLVNPFDVIPDHVTGDGYIDDAAVMNYCTAKIDRRLPKVVNSYVRRVKRATAGPPCRL